MRSSALDATGIPALDEFVKATFVLRIFAVLLTLVSLADATQRVPGVAVGLLVEAGLSFASIWGWAVLLPLVRAHPAIFALDVMASALLLLFAGPVSAFFIYTLGTALLAGVLYGRFGAAFFAVALCAGFAYATVLWSPDPSFMTVVGLPALYFVFGFGGNYVADSYRRQSADAAALAGAVEQEATLQERARLARELHDSVSKTVLGVALQAAALRERLDRDGNALVGPAEQLCRAAQQAVEESRSTLIALRSESSALSFANQLEHAVAQVEQSAGVTVRRRDIDRAELDTAQARFEVLRVVIEALRNAACHAKASEIELSVVVDETCTAIEIRDDGCGFDVATRPIAALGAGHFGLVGMRERAEQLGGRLELDSSPGQGTIVTVVVPRAGAPETVAEPVPLPGSHGPPVNEEALA